MGQDTKRAGPAKARLPRRFHYEEDDKTYQKTFYEKK